MSYCNILISLKNTSDNMYGYNAYKNFISGEFSEENYKKKISSVKDSLESLKQTDADFCNIYHSKDVDTEKFLDISTAINVMMSSRYYWCNFDTFNDCTDDMKLVYDDEYNKPRDAVSINGEVYPILKLKDVRIEGDDDATDIAIVENADDLQLVYNSKGKTILAKDISDDYAKYFGSIEMISVIPVINVDVKFVKESLGKLYTFDEFASRFWVSCTCKDGRYGHEYNSKGICDTYSLIDKTDILIAKKDGDYTLSSYDDNKCKDDGYVNCSITRRKDMKVTNYIRNLKYYITSNNELVEDYDDFIKQVSDDDIIVAINIHY